MHVNMVGSKYSKITLTIVHIYSFSIIQPLNIIKEILGKSDYENKNLIKSNKSYNSDLLIF